MREQSAVVPIEDVLGQIAGFAQERGAKRVTLFGSRARGDAGAKSDIDIAIEGCADFAGFEDDVQERLWSLLQVDVVNLDDGVSPALAVSIDREGKVLYEAL